MADTIRFLLGGEVEEIHVSDPTRTVLDFLREDKGLTGTKEGCNEGDCGACTVVLAEPHGDRLRYRAVNSCIQFLPTLDGKQLITVEELGDPSGTLHPVQQSLVDLHGSQCGFCTPGFVMSLFAMFHESRAETPDRASINRLLAGNLCRCTGYAPIVRSAQDVLSTHSEDA
ncbi:MAG: 2Fe-2S iron-sulfur cluster binding domain-containing protein, partial [Xanthomonadales bacterium]|nr:2Fe-2S iron-sulfur cluster binding domain-containing protein [Xanthomonadales bacterium]NIX11689.1 2Fe-2S iron-sulfur cluster binding domain-containing protein [Xanthomonadales bacterium]